MSKIKEPMGIYSFDIETNQYYNYESWFNPVMPVDTQKQLYEVIAKEVAAECRNIPADGLSGFSHAKAVFRKVMASEYVANAISKAVSNGLSKFEAKDTAKRAVTNILVKDFPIANTKCEVYLGCFVPIGWKVNGKSFYEYSAEEFKNRVVSTAADYCYSVNEIDKYLQDLYDDAVSAKAPNVIIIHNLSYEFNTCIRQTKFFKKVLDAGLVDFLSNNAKDTIKNMTIYAPKRGKSKGRSHAALYFIDTWKLTGKSIKALGKLHNFGKLAYTYDVIRTKANLTQYDLDYNRRDCDIALLGLYDAFIQDPAALMEKYFETGSLPISANNIVSTMSKSYFTKEFMIHKKNVQAEKKDKDGNTVEPEGKSHMSADIYAAYRKTTGGGLIFVNPDFSFNPYEVGKTYMKGRERFTVKRIVHPDLNSAHPSQATKRLFPVSAPSRVDEVKYGAEFETICSIIKADAKEIAEMATLAGIKCGFDEFDNLYPHLNCKTGSLSGFATFTFTNLRAKTFKANKSKAPSFILPMLWNAKINTTESGVETYGLRDGITNRSKNAVIHCNKVYEAESLTCTITLEDFAILNLFYEWDSVDISDLYLYQLGPISPYLFRQFDHFGRKKSVYKAIVSAVEHGDDSRLNSLLQEDVVTEVDRQAITDGYAKEGTAFKDFVEKNMYAPTKFQFNGIYGSSYQSLFRNADKLELENGEVSWIDKEEAYDEKNSSGIDVLQGSYIAQWSRVDIALYTALIANEGGIPLYIATDSCYALFTEYTNPSLYDVISSVDEFGNKKYAEELPYNKQTPTLRKFRPNNNQLGGMTFEDEPQKIVYTFALKILTETHPVNKNTGEVESKINKTFSGVSCNLFFKGCTTFEECSERLLQENGYVSRFEDDPEADERCKSRRVAGSMDEEGAFELVGVEFVNNNLMNKEVVDFYGMVPLWYEIDANE